jgi:hypothetical protein
VGSKLGLYYSGIIGGISPINPIYFIRRLVFFVGLVLGCIGLVFLGLLLAGMLSSKE